MAFFNPTGKPLDENAFMSIPVMQLPDFRIALAEQRKTRKNILVHTVGGLGDMICAEPTIRKLTNLTKGKFTLVTPFPELYQHLPIRTVIDITKEKYNPADYLVLETYLSPLGLAGEFLWHSGISAVDYASLAVFRQMLPPSERELEIMPTNDDMDRTAALIDGVKRPVVVHPGASWPSRTFPAGWWNAVIAGLAGRGCTPVLVGKKSENRGTVEVATHGCIDLRERLSILETIAVMAHSDVVITNDSAPLHMAACTGAWIGFVSTAKHPEHMMHWRHGEFGYGMEDFSKGGLWENFVMPNVYGEAVNFDEATKEQIESWLPTACGVAEWAWTRE